VLIYHYDVSAMLEFKYRQPNELPSFGPVGKGLDNTEGEMKVEVTEFEAFKLSLILG
jgi:hypothetical protein